MKKRFVQVLILYMSLLLIALPLSAEATGNERIPSHPLSQPALQLKDKLRRLWLDHLIWSRAYVVSAMEGLKDEDEVLARLLQNQKDIGNAMKPYYGEAAGNKLSLLLSDHILIAGKLIKATKSGDQAKLQAYNTQWNKNADEIVQFLSNVNPDLEQSNLKKQFYMHLQHIKDMISARMKGNWEEDIVVFDIGREHMLQFADTLAKGIMKQFRNKSQQ